jgi:two-component system chemotaxis response regulator CheB
VSVEIHVLVVDDSAFMRRAIQKMCENEPDLKVIATATSGEEGVEKAALLKPDVITMDVEMPGMGGLEAARTLASRGGPPIIMVSSLTREGAETTLQALEIGAVDFIPKPDSAFIDILKVQRELVEKIRHFGTRSAYLRANRGRAIPRPQATTVPPVIPQETVAPPRAVGPRTTKFECVALGTSTGGPVALSQIIPKLPKNFPIPIIVVQHMPPGFTRPLSERLNSSSHITVVEAQDGTILRGGTAYIAPAGQQLRLRRTPLGVEIVIGPDTAKSLHVPSVDVMAAAVGETFGAGALGVILTGMGHDGVGGLRVLKDAGGFVVGQDEASSVVYGMPRAAAVAGLVDRVVSLTEVARTLCELTGTAVPIV